MRFQARQVMKEYDVVAVAESSAVWAGKKTRSWVRGSVKPARLG